MKPYYNLPIVDCGEPLVAIPPEVFAFVAPHPYEKAGAPYGEKSPFYLRQGVLDRLIQAQAVLQQTHPGWRIQIFDGYRPVAVQQYMVDYTFREVALAQGLDPDAISEQQRHAIDEQVYEFWAVPNLNPATPPPHSTGSAVDVTLVDATGAEVNLGSPIDELSPRSYPNHFAASKNPVEQTYHQQRELLCRVMTEAGFRRHPHEWWHFCCGDQMWAWLVGQETGQAIVARYGRV